jgi:sigma-B regulation protein RsbU (phosphoserine phosphatase)
MAEDEVSSLKEKISDLEHELAVKDAELHRYRLELTKANSTLEKLILQVGQEFKAAQALQKILSPTELPNVQGFEFSTKFLAGTRSGGDYFDIFEHEDKLKFGILISSSSAYTLSSLLLSAIIKMSSQIEARKGLEAAKVVELIAKEVVPQIEGFESANIFYGVIDRRTYELEYCSVGIIDCFLQTYGSEQLKELVSTSPSLNKEFNAELQSQRVQLNSRDRLIIATEGIKNSQNAAGVAWGKQRLIETISGSPRQGVHELRNAILYSNQKYTGLEDPRRDQTLIVTDVKDRVIKLARHEPG